MYVYARINKETMKFIRETKAITLDYVSRITKYSSSKIELWENSDTDKFPTINQAISCFLMGQQRNLLPFSMMTVLRGFVPQSLS